MLREVPRQFFYPLRLERRIESQQRAFGAYILKHKTDKPGPGIAYPVAQVFKMPRLRARRLLHMQGNLEWQLLIRPCAVIKRQRRHYGFEVYLVQGIFYLFYESGYFF